MTPVVRQTMATRDLVEVIVSTTGKDLARVADVLARGAVVQGGSRLRWEAVRCEGEALTAMLATFPDPDPNRPFRAGACTGVRLRAGKHVVELPREVASETRLFQRRSFWDTLMRIAGDSAPEYLDYSYKLRSDQYRIHLNADELERLRTAADLLRYSGIAAQIRTLPFECVEFSVRYP